MVKKLNIFQIIHPGNEKIKKIKKHFSFPTFYEMAQNVYLTALFITLLPTSQTDSSRLSGLCFIIASKNFQLIQCHFFSFFSFFPFKLKCKEI
jgi:hypothetical protein